MIEAFLTSYDPSDLPGGSIDPLGFERGYLFLADKILPGLTNVASRPRYFALICAGIHLQADDAESSPRDLFRNRRELFLRFERFWALANVLARPNNSGGVRGVTYAEAKADELARSAKSRTDAKYTLLSRQTQYGAIGMYASVAEGMRFFNRDRLDLTADLGEAAAEAFLRETDCPASLRRAVVDDSDIPVATLKAWGERAHVDAEVGPIEAKCLSEALHSHPVRSRMTGLLKRHPFMKDGEPELDRLARIAKALRKQNDHQDLREAIDCISAYESCYRLAQLALERLLWLCRRHAAAFVTLSELRDDPVIELARRCLPAEVQRLLTVLNDGSASYFRAGLDRLSDVRDFLRETADTAGEAPDFVCAIMRRHVDVQRGKFDQGRRKMPWLELNDSRMNLTMTRVGGMRTEVTVPEQIVPHPYRVQAADALLAASDNAANS